MFKAVITITVPYIPSIGVDGIKIPNSPDEFDPKIKRYGKTYHLKEVQGSHLVWFKKEGWCELGFNAIYRWDEPAQSDKQGRS